MLRSLYVARPDTAFLDVVPDSVPPLGLACIETVMRVEALVTRLPPASSTSTWTAGVIGAPAAVADGCTWNTSLVAVPTVMVNVFEGAPVRTVALAARG